jgi:hypothetical protein
MGCEDIIKMFFTTTTMIKLYHWQTRVHARHEASDSLHTKLSELMDKFIETYMGRYSRPSFKSSFQITVSELNDENAGDLLREFSNYLKNDLPKHIGKMDTDLLNIRDEIMGELHKTLYLYTLR